MYHIIKNNVSCDEKYDEKEKEKENKKEKMKELFDVDDEKFRSNILLIYITNSLVNIILSYSQVAEITGELVDTFIISNKISSRYSNNMLSINKNELYFITLDENY